MIIYVLTSKTRGPAGHGEPGEESISLACKQEPSDWYGAGSPYPAFSSQEKAERYRKENGLSNSYTIIPLDVL